MSNAIITIPAREVVPGMFTFCGEGTIARVQHSINRVEFDELLGEESEP